MENYYKFTPYQLNYDVSILLNGEQMCRLFTQAQKVCYKSSSVRFKQLEDLAHPLKHLYPNLPLTASTYLCQHCYNRALKLVSSTDNEFITDNEVTDNVVDRDEDF